MILGEIPWTHGFISSGIPPHIQEVERRFLDLFATYKPTRSFDITATYGYLPYEFDGPPDDPELRKRFEQFDQFLKKATRSGAAFYRQFPTGEEIEKARYLEPYYYGSFVTGELEDSANAGLTTCAACGRPDLQVLPDPLVVNKSALKSYDLYHADESFLVVRKWVLDLLKDAVGAQFIHGNVVVAKSKEQPAGDNRLFWVRPKTTLGPEVLLTHQTRTCNACGCVLDYPGGGVDYQINQLGPGLVDARTRLEHFGSAEMEIAMSDWHRIWPVILLSGALLTLLKKKGVKGIAIQVKGSPPQCVFSCANESTLRTSVKTFAVAEIKTEPKKKTSLAGARKTAASLKNLQWDCPDGNVYFHLSTPEFVVLDPMTAEDCGSPYTVTDFKGPGIYRLPVSAIKEAEEDGIAVDSATLLFVDNAFLPELLDEFEWENSMIASLDWAYCQKIAEKVGTRFGICTVPPPKYKSAFKGDGLYRIDAKRVKAVSK